MTTSANVLRVLRVMEAWGLYGYDVVTKGFDELSNPLDPETLTAPAEYCVVGLIGPVDVAALIQELDNPRVSPIQRIAGFFNLLGLTFNNVGGPRTVQAAHRAYLAAIQESLR